MNNLISVNNKFMEISPKKLVSMIKGSKSVKGLEIYVDITSPRETSYLDDLVSEIKKENLILQIHGNVNLPLSDQVSFLKKLEGYADYLEYKIVVTLHSVSNNNKDISKQQTISYMKDIIDNVDNNKLVICLENLNNMPNLDRLGKDEIAPIILDNKSLYFTYDLGHALTDNDNLINLNEDIFKKIRNVHIHSNDDKGNDHMPIYSTDKYFNHLLDGLKYLFYNKYKYNIVYEYDLYACKGSAIEEKIQDYLNSIDDIFKLY